VFWILVSDKVRDEVLSFWSGLINGSATTLPGKGPHFGAKMKFEM
jgi:hypothetical protein